MMINDNLDFYKCNHCGYYFLNSKKYDPRCPQCDLLVAMTTKERIDAQARKQRYVEGEIVLFKGYDDQCTYKKVCEGCQRPFFTENKGMRKCLTCLGTKNMKGFFKL